MTTFRLRHFPVKSGRFLCLFGRVQGWLREVLQGQGQSQEVQGSLELQNCGLRGLGEACIRIQVEAISCQVLGYCLAQWQEQPEQEPREVQPE